MLRIYSCIAEGHDVRLVALAAFICLLSSLVAFQVYGRARADSGLARLAWVGVMAVVAGIGTWATHFVAMLAFQPHLPSAYEPRLTVLSLAIAVVVMGSGILIAASSPVIWRRALGGGLVGAGVAAMHYTGMAALLVPGHLIWDASYVAGSVALGVVLGSAAFHTAGSGLRWGRLVSCAVILTLAIASLHFTGMAAVTIAFDPTVTVPEQSISSGLLASGVTAATLLVLCIGAVCIVMDLHSRRSEEKRLRDFADAAVEGLVICHNGAILDANESFCCLAGKQLADLRGQSFKDLLALETRERIDPETPLATEGQLLQADDGSVVPVSIIARDLKGREQARTVFAVRDLREQKEAERRIRFLAHHDALTGLPNRVTFAEALDQGLKRAKRDGGSVAVLCIDIDHFKAVNDLFGHLSGDEVLVEATRRMRRALGEGDLLARLSGDEFAVIQTLRAQPHSATALAQSLIEAMKEDFEVAGSRITSSLSIGLAIGPADGSEPERLLTNADTALYRAKSEGRGRFRCFEPEMDLRVRERHALAAELRQAIARDELTLFYQPQVKGSTGELIGFEALVRWIHPKRGLIPPGDFIPVAEEMGLIIPLGEWVLRTACREAAQWSRPLKIAVNLSPMQFQQPNLPEVVQGVLLETGLSGPRLELEITETVIINDLSRALALLRRLKLLGVRIAMDDFGTGYSSLATLQAFPFDKIKIDRSFVGKIGTHAQAAVIVRAVLGLGKNLGMGVVAEGVETEAQMKFLTDEACDEVQGYLFGKPQPIEHFASMVYEGAISLPVRRSA